MRKIISNIFVVILLMALLLALTGCVQHSLKDIEDYAKNDIGIKGYKIQNNYTEVKDKYGDLSDKYWHVKYKDIEFDIIDNFYSQGEFTLNELEDNFTESVLDYYYNKYDNANKITYESITKSIICDVADSDGKIDETKLKQDYDNIVDFIKTIDFNTYPIKEIYVKITGKNNYVKWLLIYENNHINTFEEFYKIS